MMQLTDVICVSLIDNERIFATVFYTYDTVIPLIG